MGFHSTNKMWKKDETAALIALFETERCLYDPSERDYHDPEKKTEAYDRICKIMLRIRPDVSVDEIKYKIKVLRKQYEGELLHRNVSIETGICTKDSYKPGMWCFGLLQFLDDYLNIQNVGETSIKYEDNDEEVYHVAENDDHKDAEECSDIIDESDEHEDEERISSKKRKMESSSSSSERESLNSTIKKFLNSSSEKKHQNTSFSVKKFHSSSSIEKKLQNTSTSVRKFSGSSSFSDKKISKPAKPLVKNSVDTPSTYKKLQTAVPSHKKNQNAPPCVRKFKSVLSSERKVASSFQFEKNVKSSSSDGESKNSSLAEESPVETRRKFVPKTYSRAQAVENRRNYSPDNCSKDQEEGTRRNYSPENHSKSQGEASRRNYSPENHSRGQEKSKRNCSPENHSRNQGEETRRNYSPERPTRQQSSPERDVKIFGAADNEAKLNSLERELFTSPQDIDVLEKNSALVSTVDREDIFGRYVACELRALRHNPVIYLQTKQSILESLTCANFELINPE